MTPTVGNMIWDHTPSRWTVAANYRPDGYGRQDCIPGDTEATQHIVYYFYLFPNEQHDLFPRHCPV